MRLSAPKPTPRTIAVGGGVLYALVVLTWLLGSGVYFDTRDPATLAAGVGYAVVGMVLVAAVPVYLCGRLSLVTPTGVTVWFLGVAASEWLSGTHLHPLSSYLTAWPVLLGVAAGAGLLEAVARLALDRSVGRFGLRPLIAH